MDLPPDPISQAWQSLWLALAGAAVYTLLDLLVLRKNPTFAKGSKLFRIGVAVLAVGVAVGGLAWVYFAKADTTTMNRVLYGSYAVRSLGAILAIIAITKMLRKPSS